MINACSRFSYASYFPERDADGADQNARMYEWVCVFVIPKQ